MSHAAAVILAAGRSRRMGQPKLLLPWGNESILAHLIQTWRLLGVEQVGIVYSENDDALRGELDRVGTAEHNRIPNPTPEDGMFSSIRCAALYPQWSATLTHFAIVLGDQPHLKMETLRELLKLAARHPDQVCQPRHENRLHHPVILPREIFFNIKMTPANTLKDFLQTQPVAACDVNDPGLSLDIDLPEDYQRALALWKKSNG